MKADPGMDGAETLAHIPLRVLIVEDSEDDTLLLVRELEKGGFEPEHERVDTPENMRRALTDREPWDVVLSDWRMPRFSGTEALEIMRETDPETPFVIVSGKVGEEAAVEAMRAGAHDYVMKDNLWRVCATVERGLLEAEARRERRQAEAERDRLFELSMDLLGVVGLDGYFKRVSPAFEETLGYTSGELLARPFIEFVHPEDRAKSMSALEGLGQGVRIAYFENRYLRNDGSVVWLEWKGVPVVEENLIYATARDVTERKRAEEALRRRDAILRAVGFAAERFLERVASWEESAQEVLERLGRAAEVSRVYIFENYTGEDGERWGTLSYEWVAPGVSAQIDNPLMQAIPYRAAGFGRWGELIRGGGLHGQTREFPEDERPLLEEQDVLSIALVPIFVEGEWWGHIGFDECLAEREWSAAEIDALKAAADTLGAAIQRERAEEALRRRDAILRAVAFAAERFLERVASWEESAQEVLERLGVAAEVSRVYILENHLGDDGEARVTLRYEWVAPGISAQIDNPRVRDLPYRAAGFGRWMETLSRGELIYGHTREFPQSERPELEAQDIRSIAVVPIFAEGEWWGQIGFDECFAEREWSDAEIDALKAACDTLGAAIQRERAEEAMRQSEQLYRTVVEQATEYISLVDVETRRFVGSNRAFREALGYSEEELRDMTLYDIVAHDRGSIDENARRVVERGRYSLGERKHRRKDGTLVDVEVSASTVFYEGREVACIVGHDVTERKRAEEEVRESQRALATLMSNLPGMAYRCRNDPDWTMELVSEGCLELTGYPPIDLIDNRRRTYGDLIHPDDREEVWESVQAALASPERPTFQFNYRITTASGATRWVWEQGRGVFSPEGTLLALEGFVTDITERKRARDELAQSEERYRAVVEQAAEGIFLFDAATGDVLESNAAFGELLGYTVEELLDMRMYDFVAHDRESIDSNIQRVLNEGGRFIGERKYRRKDGSLADVAVSANLISYDGREVICAVIRDVTERVEAFRMLEEHVTALAGISASLAVGQTMEATLDALAGRIVQSTAAVACAVVLMNAETGLFRAAGSQGLPEGYTASLEAAYRAGMRPPPVEVFRTRRPMLVRDARQAALNTPFSFPMHGFLREVPWDTIYFVPLVSRGQALGVLNLYYLPGQEPGEEETVFLDAAADQTAVAIENAQLFAAAQGKAALEERQRLARELHDSVSQALYGIALGSRTAHALLDQEAPPERVAEWLEYVLSLAEAGLTEMRSLIFELRPESLETEGLVAALKQQAAALGARYEIPVHATLGNEPDLPLETKETLYRIAQEALHNTVKHARASRADLKLECDARGIALEVSDDGAGFDPGGDFSGHLGLKSMRERAARLGGTLRVESTPGEGTSIRVRIPSDT